MNIKEMVNYKGFLTDSVIKELYSNGYLSIQGAILLYFDAKFKLGKQVFTSLPTVCNKLGISYDSSRHAVKQLESDGVLIHNKCKSKVEVNGKTRWVKEWIMKEHNMEHNIISKDNPMSIEEALQKMMSCPEDLIFETIELEPVKEEVE